MACESWFGPPCYPTESRALVLASGFVRAPVSPRRSSWRMKAHSICRAAPGGDAGRAALRYGHRSGQRARRRLARESLRARSAGLSRLRTYRRSPQRVGYPARRSSRPASRSCSRMGPTRIPARKCRTCKQPSAPQFRAEFFNVMNRTNLGTPNATVFSSGAINASAGLITTTATTPRQIQFGLKLIF
jgi:hypothetical protein